MACYRPVTAWRPLQGGAVSFHEIKDCREIQIPCGRCIGCRIKRQEMWATRCYAESKMHDRNAFITLTYDEEHWPQNGSLNYGHFQSFLKRLRRRAGSFRFFMCGEYGDQTWRPHYHALIFGYDFPDKRKSNSLYSKHDLFSSELLSETWGRGLSSIGEVNYSTARYVASYTLKKISGEAALDHYSRVNTETGEIVSLEPEFAHMSLKPGIGARWFERYWKECYVHDGVYLNDNKKPLPRYFDKLMEVLSPEVVDEMDYQRYLRADACREHSTRERLAVREHVEKARLSFNKQRRGNASEI